MYAVRCRTKKNTLKIYIYVFYKDSRNIWINSFSVWGYIYLAVHMMSMLHMNSQEATR